MKTLIFVIAFISFPVISQADDDDYRYERNKYRDHSYHHFWNTVDNRITRQLHRINQGIENGALTRREARKLQRQHHKLDRRIDRIRCKNWIDHYDKQRVISYLDEASDRIYRLKHNNHYAERHHGLADNYPYYQKNNALIWSNNGYSTGFFFRY